MSKNRQWLRSWLGFELFLTMALIMSVAALPAQGGSPPASAGEGSMSYKTPYVVLSGEFFQAMEKLANSEVVTGDLQQKFLEQIATAQRFMVKTNLTLIQQNEKIIHLLEELNRQRQSGGR